MFSLFDVMRMRVFEQNVGWIFLIKNFKSKIHVCEFPCFYHFSDFISWIFRANFVIWSLFLPTEKMPKLLTVIYKFKDEYVNSTPKKLKIIDAYLLYVLLTGIIQFLYCCLVGTFPFNSFLSGFISCVSCFILAGI